MTKTGGIWRFFGWLKVIKDDALILYYAWRHPGTPRYIKGLLIAVIAYVFSPVDVIPDYLPVIGIADDVALIPAAVLYLTRLLPRSVLADCERESERWRKRVPWLLGLLVASMLAWITLALIGLGYLLF